MEIVAALLATNGKSTRILRIVPARKKGGKVEKRLAGD